MATTWTVQPLAVARSKYDAAPLRNDQYIEAASQSYIRGAVLQQNASATGAVELYPASSSTDIIGIATVAAGGSGSQAFFHEVHEGTIIEANWVGASSAAIAQTDIGAIINFVASSGVFHAATTASGVGIVTGLAGMSEIGDTNPRVEIVVHVSDQAIDS